MLFQTGDIHSNSVLAVVGVASVDIPVYVTVTYTCVELRGEHIQYLKLTLGQRAFIAVKSCGACVFWRSILQKSMPSPSGSITSRRTKSGIHSSSLKAAVCAEFAQCTVYPSFSRNERLIRMMSESASRTLYDFIKTPILRHIQMPNLISMSSL